MSWIRKTVSIPAKWAVKSVVKGWLLKFPDRNPQSPVACVYCPEMCRFSCPTAVVSGNDAVTPANKMGLLHLNAKWDGALEKQAVGGELWPLYDCTGCGRCTEYCVYEMPVAERLFASREQYGWSRAHEVFNALDATEDLFGDLAEELGKLETARERARRAVTLTGWRSQWIEPKSWEWLKRSGAVGADAVPVWLGGAARVRADRMTALSGGGDWLFVESVWHSRRLELAQQAQEWIEILRSAGLCLQRPFAQGMDCVDSGGEGIYARLFADQARAMALDIWGRDRHRAQGVVTVSTRARDHFRAIGVQAWGVEDLLEWK